MQELEARLWSPEMLHASLVAYVLWAGRRALSLSLSPTLCCCHALRIPACKDDEEWSLLFSLLCTLSCVSTSSLRLTTIPPINPFTCSLSWCKRESSFSPQDCVNALQRLFDYVGQRERRRRTRTFSRSLIEPRPQKLPVRFISRESYHRQSAISTRIFRID